MLRFAYRLGTMAESPHLHTSPAAPLRRASVSPRFTGNWPLEAKPESTAVPKRHGSQGFLNPVLAIDGKAGGGAIASGRQLIPQMRGGTCALWPTRRVRAT